MYLVWDAFDARGFCRSLLGGFFDLRAVMGSCEGVYLTKFALGVHVITYFELSDHAFELDDVKRSNSFVYSMDSVVLYLVASLTSCLVWVLVKVSFWTEFALGVQLYNLLQAF